MEKQVICQYCNADLSDDPGSNFCPECGKPIVRDVPVYQQPVQNNYSPKEEKVVTNIPNTREYPQQPDYQSSYVGNAPQMPSFFTSDKFRQFCVRRYFIGFGKAIILIPIIYFVISYIKILVLSFFGNFGRLFGGYGYSSYYRESSGPGFGTILFMLLILCYIAFTLYLKFSSSVLRDVEAYTANAREIMKSRSIKKFNVDVEQVKEIEPIIINGFGNSPSVFSKSDVHGFISSFFTTLILMFKGFTTDPIEAYKLGKDRILRGMLISTTIYYFTDSQVLIYKGNIDVSTGIIYDEAAWEVFYTDINYVDLREIMKKARTFLIFRHSYHANAMVLGVNGSELSSTFDTRFTSPNFRESLTAMKNLIREKNKELTSS